MVGGKRRNRRLAAVNSRADGLVVDHGICKIAVLECQLWKKACGRKELLAHVCHSQPCLRQVAGMKRQLVIGNYSELGADQLASLKRQSVSDQVREIDLREIKVAELDIGQAGSLDDEFRITGQTTRPSVKFGSDGAQIHDGADHSRAGSLEFSGRRIAVGLVYRLAMLIPLGPRLLGDERGQDLQADAPELFGMVDDQVGDDADTGGVRRLTIGSQQVGGGVEALKTILSISVVQQLFVMARAANKIIEGTDARAEGQCAERNLNQAIVGAQKGYAVECLRHKEQETSNQGSGDYPEHKEFQPVHATAPSVSVLAAEVNPARYAGYIAPRFVKPRQALHRRGISKVGRNLWWRFG